MLKNKKGLALIAAIMLIVFVSITVLGLSVFIVQWYKQLEVGERQARCIYNALAGINYAIYQYRVNGVFPSDGTVHVIDDDNSCTLASAPGNGQAAGNLTINATNSSRGGNNNRDILGITVTNTSSTSSITLDRIVLYVSNSSEVLDRISINGVLVRNANDTINTTPNNLDLTTNATIPANTTRAINYIRFTNSFGPTNLYLSFIMTDGSTSSTCTVYPAQASPCVTNDVTVRSMGKTANSTPEQYRTIKAVYNKITGNISDYDESFIKVQ